MSQQQQLFDRFYPPTATLSLFDKFSLISYRIFKAPATLISKQLPLLRENLLKSDLRVTPVGLVAVALFSTALAAIVASGIIIWVRFGSRPSYLYLVAIAPIIVFASMMNAPRISRSSRGSALQNELPFVVGYMSILAGGGLSMTDTLRQISQMDIFKSASKEAKRILIDIDVFGRDPITALDKAAKYSPLKEWTELLTGYTTVLRTGGDHVNYLNLHLRETFENMSTRIKRMVETVGLVSESFLIVTVVLGMTLFTLYLVEALVNNSPAGISNIFIFSFVIVPLLSAGFIWLIDAFSQKWPFTDMRPYKIFLLFIPLGGLLFFAPLPLKLYQHVAVALLGVSLVPALFATRYSRERRTIEGMLPAFIEDVAEQRKIGLPPEQAIERLGEGNAYGAFSKYVSKMGGQLSWGVSLTKVIQTFARDVKSWIARAVGTLMLEVVEIGGGTLRGFEDMAAFTRRLSSTESEARSALRPYVLIIYVGGLMLVLTTFVMVNLISQQAALSARGLHFVVSKSSPLVIDQLVTAAVFQGWVLGLVAGKMGEGSLAEGFKHSVILVILTLIAVVVAGWFTPLNL